MPIVKLVELIEQPEHLRRAAVGREEHDRDVLPARPDVVRLKQSWRVEITRVELRYRFRHPRIRGGPDEQLLLELSEVAPIRMPRVLERDLERLLLARTVKTRGSRAAKTESWICSQRSGDVARIMLSVSP